MEKKDTFLCRISEIFCPKNVLIVVFTIIFLLLIVHYVPASITQISHVYQHNPGECHINQECRAGQICFKECTEFDQNGICASQQEIGNCTSYCNELMPCVKGTCQEKLLWNGASGNVVKICV